MRRYFGMILSSKGASGVARHRPQHQCASEHSCLPSAVPDMTRIQLHESSSALQHLWISLNLAPLAMHPTDGC
jgi:hypothetical protein